MTIVLDTMLRPLSLILLLALLPRLAFAPPAAVAICVAQDHVSRFCHSTTADAEHNADAFNASLQSNDGDCVDIPQSSDDVLTIKAAGTGQLLHPLMHSPSFLSMPLWIRSIEHPALSPDEPARFCARSFCCSIAIRC